MEFVLNASNTKGRQDDAGVVEVFVRHEIRSAASPKPPQQDQPKNPNQPDWIKVENNDLVEFVGCVPKDQDYELSLYTSTGLKELPSTSNTPLGVVTQTLESLES